MNIEELSHEDYVAISKMIPKKLRFKDIQSIAKAISLKFDTPKDDSIGSVFIAATITFDNTVSNYEATKVRRVAEVIRVRVKTDD